MGVQTFTVQQDAGGAGKAVSPAGVRGEPNAGPEPGALKGWGGSCT